MKSHYEWFIVADFLAKSDTTSVTENVEKRTKEISHSSLMYQFCLLIL